MKEHPLFTVIITTYNAEKFVGRAIECVLNQTCQDFELIVANDGSPDRSKEITAGYMQKSDKIIFLDLPHSGGPAAPTNAALRQSRGRLIAFLEYDDEWDRTRLEKMAALFERYPDTGYAGSNVIQLNDVTGQAVNFIFSPDDLKEETRKFKAIHGGLWTGWSNITIARRVFEDIGFLDEKVLIGPDYDYYLRVGLKYPFRYINELLLTYHIHTTNISGGNPLKDKKILADNEHFLQKHSELYKLYPKMYARRMQDVAEMNMRVGNTARARRLFLRSIRTYPFDPKTYVKFVLSLPGAKSYNRIRFKK